MWTKEEHDQLVWLLERNASWHECGFYLGRSAAACCGYAKRQKLYLPKRISVAALRERDWRERRLEEARAWGKRWREENPDYVALHR